MLVHVPSSHTEFPSTNLRTTPWLKVGTRLKPRATSIEAVNQARLGWEVAKAPDDRGSVSHTTGPTKTYVLVRNDPKGRGNGTILGRVNEDYVPLQNRQAFASFDPIVEAGAAEYEAAGELAGGQKVWILARLPRPIQVTGDDSVLKYLLLVNNHAGPSPGVQIGLTPLRIVCTNMLTVALQLGRGMRFEHRPELHAQLSRAAETLSLLEEGFSEIEANFKRMTQAPMAHRSLLDYLAEVFPEPPEVGADARRLVRGYRPIAR